MKLEPNQLALVDDLFDQALDVPADQRSDFLARECPDEAIRSRVQRLLAAEQRESVVDQPARVMDGLLDEGGILPPRIGPYRPTRVLGHGGMAVVYLAERTDGHFEQSVALKLIPAGQDRQRVVRHFERERQILASLDHPSIARLFDGGMAEDGRPYFAMEHVDGLPIDQHCDENRLSIEQRLLLFREVALAVHFAHRRLVLHRDLKPSNILVTRGGQVKLLDFGIATVLAPDQEGSHTTSRWLTPDYASPEQIRGEAMSTAADIYQLGLLLYHLLTGRMPYRTTGSFAQTERVICEVMPTRPSNWFRGSLLPDDTEGWSREEAATLRSTQQPRIYRRLRGDLDTIVLKCLRKEPARRYASAERLAADISHYLDGLPVSAHPDSLLYRTGKALRRNARAAAAAALIAGLLAYNVAVVYRKNVEIAAERDRSQAEAAKATAIKDYVIGLFENAHPSVARGEDLGIRDILDLGAPLLASAFPDQPLVRAEMQAITGELYKDLGDFEQAEELFLESLEAARHQDDLAYLTYQGRLADVLLSRGENQQAEAMYRRVLVEWQRAGGTPSPDLAEIKLTFANLLLLLRNNDEARSQAEQALAIYRSVHGERHPTVADAISTLADIEKEAGRLTEAETMARSALEMRLDLLPDGHPNLAVSYFQLADTLTELDLLREAEPLFRTAIESFTRILGPEHPHLLNSLSALAVNLRRQGDPRESAELHKRSLAIRRARFPPSHPSIATNLNDLGAVMREMGELMAAEEYFREALSIYTPDNPWRDVTVGNLASILRQTGRYDEARQRLEPLLERNRASYGAEHLQVAMNLWELGLIHSALGDGPAAIEAFEQASSIFDITLPPGHARAFQLDSYLAGVLIDQGELEEAEALLLAAAPPLRERYGEHRHTARVDLGLGRIHLARGELARAAPLLETAHRILAPLTPHDAEVTEAALRELAILRQLPDSRAPDRQPERVPSGVQGVHQPGAGAAPAALHGPH